VDAGDLERQNVNLRQRDCVQIFDHALEIIVYAVDGQDDGEPPRRQVLSGCLARRIGGVAKGLKRRVSRALIQRDSKSVSGIFQIREA
jgi:hypothetical protein